MRDGVRGVEDVGVTDSHVMLILFRVLVPDALVIAAFLLRRHSDEDTAGLVLAILISAAGLFSEMRP